VLRGPGLLLTQTASAGGASSRPPAVRHRRPGRHCQDARHGVGRRSVSSIGVYPSGVAVRVSSRPVSSRPVSGHLGSSSGWPAVRASAVPRSGVQPSGVQPAGVRPSSVQPAGVCPVGPDASVSSHNQTVAVARVAAAGTRHPRPGRVPVGWVRAAVAARDRLSDQAGRRAERRGWRRREVAAPAAWLPSWVGWATTLGGGRGAGCRGGRTPEGPMGLLAGMGCGPSAARAGSGRSRLATSSAVTCGNGWWACQDLNLGPHPDRKTDRLRLI
jgi:hypothetical protein